MFENEEYSSFLKIFTKIRLARAILLIYKFYIPISTFRVSYKATTLAQYDSGSKLHSNRPSWKQLPNQGTRPCMFNTE